MDRSAAKKIVDRELEPLQDRLGIPHWRIQVAYDLKKSEGGWTTPGRCELRVDYNKAWIELDPHAFEDEDELLATLRHELFHIVAHPFELLCHLIKPAIERDPAVVEVLNHVRVHAVEQLVINLERMYRGLTREQPMKIHKPKSPKIAIPKAKAKKPLSPKQLAAIQARKHGTKHDRGKG